MLTSVRYPHPIVGALWAWLLMTTVLHAQGDTTPPGIEIQSPAAGQVVSGQVTIRIRATDSGSGLFGQPAFLACGQALAPITLTAVVQTAPTPGAPVVEYTASHVWDTTASPDGSCELVMTVQDCATPTANTTTVRRTVIIKNQPDPPPPPPAPVVWRHTLIGVVGAGALRVAENPSTTAGRLQLDWLTVENQDATRTTTVRLIAGQGSGCGTLRENLSPAYTLTPYDSHTFLDRPVPVGKNLCLYTTTAAVTVRGEAKWSLQE